MRTKIVMTSYMTGKNFSYSPGDVVEFDDKEAQRILSVGGAKPYVEPAEAGEGASAPSVDDGKGS